MNRKIKIALTEEELNLIINALNELRTKQIREGGITEPINDLLYKLLK